MVSSNVRHGSQDNNDGNLSGLYISAALGGAAAIAYLSTRRYLLHKDEKPDNEARLSIQNTLVHRPRLIPVSPSNNRFHHIPYEPWQYSPNMRLQAADILKKHISGKDHVPDTIMKYSPA